jgi:hypothetical protein
MTAETGSDRPENALLFPWVKAMSAEIDALQARLALPSPAGLYEAALEQDDFSLNHHPAPTSCLSMIFFRKPVPTFRDHALARRTIP